MEDILHYRRQFYEKHYDIRVICEPNDTVSSIAEKVYKAYTNFQAKSGKVKFQFIKHIYVDIIVLTSFHCLVFKWQDKFL